MQKYFVFAVVFNLIFSCAIKRETNTISNKFENPKQVIPSTRQLNWQKLEYYGFIHFNMNTFTDKEWGYGNENPLLFNPRKLDAEQWVKVAKKAGMKGIILTAKHHDGFCLWPSKFTAHTIANSPYKNGEGDIVKELADACKKHNLLFGVYLSPWDRNHAAYGKDEYVNVFLGQLEELLTNYGDLFEVWFDGANGGDGFYGGANEHRKIDADTYYQWEKVIAMVRKHQPNAVIFGAKGADIRWIGNELGIGSKTNWSTMNAGMGDHVSREILQQGVEGGNVWKPAEADVSVRPGWYYHPREDHLVRPLSQLVDIYYHSVGRNANLLLNIPVDNHGLVHENDEKRLYKLKEVIEADFKNKISQNAVYAINNNQINNNILSDDYLETFEVLNAEKPIIELDLKAIKEFNRLQLQENIEYGQNIKKFKFEIYNNNEWVRILEGTTIGYQRLFRFSPVKAQKVRLVIEESLNKPLISTFNLYKAPNLLVAPTLIRNKAGDVSFQIPDEQLEIYYSFENKEVQNFEKFSKPLKISKPTKVYYTSFDPEIKKYSEVQVSEIDIPKIKWNVIDSAGNKIKEGEKAIDENIHTVYASSEKNSEIIIDLGEKQDLSGFTYLPSQERWAFGTIKNFEFYGSNDLKEWRLVKKGEFSNIKNNPIEQKKFFKPLKIRYIKLKSIETTDGSEKAAFAEVGVITEN